MRAPLPALLLALLGACGTGAPGTDVAPSEDAPSADVRGDGGPAGPELTYAPNTYLALPSPDGAGPAGLADPHALKVDDRYYLYGTSTERDLAVWWSDDLATWTYGGVVWRPTPGTWNDGAMIWAPHVERWEDGYYLYYSAHLRIGVARADTPLGPFAEVLDRPLVGDGGAGIGARGPDGEPTTTGSEQYAIDAFVLRRAEGPAYLYFTAYTPLTTIHGIPMRGPAEVEDVAPTPLLTADVLTWEGFIAEGTWIVEEGGRFHLLYSGNGGSTKAYAVGVAVADAPLGPYVRRADNPILHAVPDLEFWGPGHLSVAPGAFGDRLAFYHTKLAPEVGWERRPRYALLEVDAAGNLVIAGPARSGPP